jgi:hypothetical protein
MRSVRAVLLIAFVLALASGATGQSSSKVVKVSTGEAPYKIKKGATTQVAVVLDIEKGYHINSNRPTDKNLIATVLKLEKTAGLGTTTVRYPKAKMEKFGFSPKPLSVFDGRVKLLFSVRALPSAAAGQQSIRGKLTIQACNNEVCLRPQTVDVTIPVEVL